MQTSTFTYLIAAYTDKSGLSLPLDGEVQVQALVLVVLVRNTVSPHSTLDLHLVISGT